VAISAKRNQIFICVVTQPAPPANVVDLKTIGAAAILASPVISFQHIATKLAVGIRVEP